MTIIKFFLWVILGVSICKTTQVENTIFQFNILFPSRWEQMGNAICFFILLRMASSDTSKFRKKNYFIYGLKTKGCLQSMIMNISVSLYVCLEGFFITACLSLFFSLNSLTHPFLEVFTLKKIINWPYLFNP